MIKIRNIDNLQILGFKEYKSGLSLKIHDYLYDFFDISFKDFIVNKVIFVEDHFEYKNAEENDIRLLINKRFKNKTERFKEEFFNNTFEVKNKERNDK